MSLFLLAGTLCAAMALIVVGLWFYGQRLDAEMDLVNAARSGA